MNIYQLRQHLYQGEDESTLLEDKIHREYEDYSIQNYGNFVFKQKTSTNMDKLWRIFHENQDYPELYMGMVDKMARCKCMITGKDEWHNINLFSDISTNPLSNGDHITLKRVVKNKMYHIDCIFIKWEKETFYEWKMTSGNVLQLRQQYVDGLSPKDKRYLKMST
jgi:hypothetical protein